MITEAFRKLFKKLYDENSQGGGGGSSSDTLVLYPEHNESWPTSACGCLYTDKEHTKPLLPSDLTPDGKNILVLLAASKDEYNVFTLRSYGIYNGIGTITFNIFRTPGGSTLYTQYIANPDGSFTWSV